MICPVTGVNTSRFYICIIVGCLFLFGFEFIFHSKILMETYLETPDLWRPAESMKEFFPLSLLRIAAIVSIIALIYTKGHEGKGIIEGLRFGLLIGGFMGVMMASSYIWMPISQHLAMMWFGGGLFTGLGLGVINALLYQHPSEDSAKKDA